MRKGYSVFACFGVALLLALQIPAQAFSAEDPDHLYRRGQYREAMSGYEKLDLDHPKETRYRFNRGCAAYQLRDYQRARAAFTSVYSRSQDSSLRFKAAYNLGNTGYQAGDYEAAANDFKEAIRSNPKSAEARYNLELALKKIEQAQKQPEQNRQGKDSQRRRQDKQQGEQKEQKQDQQGKGEQNQDRTKSQTKEQPKDLSGQLKANAPAQMQKSDGNPGETQQAKSMESKKAEALLNSIREDRTRYRKMQSAEGKNGNVRSGKYW